MQFNTLSVVKAVVSGVVGIGAGRIVKSVITNNMSAPETLMDKVSMVSGAWVIAGIVTKASKKYTDDAIDDIAEATTEIVNKFKLSSKLGRINREESTFADEGLDEADFQKNDAGKWFYVSGGLTIGEPNPVSDEIFEKIKKTAEEDGLSVTIEKIDGKWTLVDKPTTK